MWFSPSISSAVATLVAIMQNASCGVRTLIACQLRLSTSTIVLFSMSDINFNGVMEYRSVGVLNLVITPLLHHPMSFRCLFFVEMRLAASPGFAPGPPVSETGALLITPRGRKKWDNGLVECWIGGRNGALALPDSNESL